MNRRDFLKVTGAALSVTALGIETTPQVSVASSSDWAQRMGRTAMEGFAFGIQHGQFVGLSDKGNLVPADVYTYQQQIVGIANRDIYAGESVDRLSFGSSPDDDVLIYGRFEGTGSIKDGNG